MTVRAREGRPPIVTRILRCASVLGAASITAAAAALSGCASHPPRTRPELSVDVPTKWTAAPDAPATVESEAARTSPWWSTFGDRQLDRLVDLALENNRDLAAAAARVEAAAAQARIAGADLQPQASFDNTSTRQRRNFIGFPIPGGGSRVLSTTTTTHGASINISWEADLWGRLRAGKAAALATVEASQADLLGARLSLAGQTAKAWFALIEAQQQVILARETLENRRLTRRRIERRYELGIRPALDLRLAISNEAGSEAILAVRERQLDAAQRQLDLLLSRYPEGDLEVSAGNLTLPDLPGPVPAGLPGELVTRRPDLIAAERRLAAAGLAVREARAALYPQLRLTGSAGRLSGEIEDLLHDDFSIWSLASSILQPLFQGGRLRAGADLVEARYREAAESYVQAALRAFRDVESSLAAEVFLARQTDALQEAAIQSAAAQRLAEERYAAGLDDYLSLLEAQRQSRLAHSQLLEVRRQLLTSRVDLHLSLGGGFVPSSSQIADPSDAAVAAAPALRPGSGR